MKTSIKTLMLTGALLGLVSAGCSSSGSNNTTMSTGSTTSTGGQDLAGLDGGNQDVGMTTGNDMGQIGPVDIGAPVLPSVMLVSKPAVAVGLVTSSDGAHALYLASPVPQIAPTFDNMTGQQTGSGAPTEGVLHLVDSQANDTVVQIGAKAATVPFGGYTFSPDGTQILYEIMSFAGSSMTTLPSASLVVAPVASPTTGVTVLPGDVDCGQPITFSTGIGGGFWAGANTTNFVMGVNDQLLQSGESLVVITLGASPAKTFEVQNGAFGYLEVGAADTLYYQALAGGTTTAPTNPPVQTLYSVPLTGLPGASPTTVTTRTSTLVATSDTFYWLTTTGDLFSAPINASGALTGAPTLLTTASSPSPIPTAPMATQFTVGQGGTVAYVGGDGSLHVLQGGNEIYKTAAKTVDLFSPLQFTFDGSLYFFKYVKTQEQRGILYYADLSSATGPATTVSTPTAVFGTVTGLADAAYDQTATYLYSVNPQGGGSFLAQNNLPAAGSPFGSTLLAPLVVSGAAQPIASNVPANEFRFGATAVGLLYNGAADPSANTRLTGQGMYGGNLGITDLTSPATSILASANQTDVVSAGNYQWSDDGYSLVFIEQVVAGTTPAFNATAMNYAGTLHVYDVAGGSGDHPLTFGGTAASNQVTEVGPVIGRTAFLISCDPASAAARGVYYLSY